MNIVADNAIPFLRGVFEPYAAVRYLPGAAIAPADVHDADVLIVRTRTRCDEALLGGSRVRLVVTATIGTDHIDTAWCAAHGIRVESAAGCNARGVLQWIAALLALLSRRQGWHPTDRVLGIVGVGHVGSLVRTYAEAWGFRTLCCDPPREEREHLGFRPLEEVASTADLLTFHVPLDATTRHLADATLLARMKPSALLVNSSRGAVVDSAALLRSGIDCALDVWEDEPRLDPALVARALVATPHIAGYSLQGKANATARAVEHVAAFFGLPLRGWYPAGVRPSHQRLIGWEEMCRTIDRYFDIEAQSRALKAAPPRFEAMRDGYTYREEYF